MSVSIKYKGSEILNIPSGGDYKLNTSGKYLEDDIRITDSGGGGAISIVDTLDSHGGTIRTITTSNTTPVLVSKTITENGTYNPSSDNASGYSSVTVNVSGGGDVDDYPTFTITCNANWEPQSITCDKTFAECVTLQTTGVARFIFKVPNEPDFISGAYIQTYGPSLMVYQDTALMVEYNSNGSINWYDMTPIELTATQNGTYTDSQGRLYSSVTVNVPSSSATQHEIHLEFTDSTDTDIDVYYDDPLIGTMITSYEPVTYGQKTVTLAQLDGVTWYEPAAIPIGVELIDYTAVKNGYLVSENDGTEVVSQWSSCSDFTLIDPSMTFSYIGYRWYNIVFFNSSKQYISAIYMDNDADSYVNDYAHGTLTPAKIPSTAKYVRIDTYPTNPNSSQLSLIRTA